MPIGMPVNPPMDLRLHNRDGSYCVTKRMPPCLPQTFVLMPGGEALQQIPPLIALGTMENPYSPLHSTTS